MHPPRSSSRLLTDFLNHGLLPFVGRRAELDVLTTFWRAGREAERLRVATLVGEAGVGKSRLLGALAARIRREGGVELRMTLHPEAANAVAPHLTSALWYSEFGRMLLREEPDGTLAAAIASLRRLARLRPALVVIEDLHLLGTDGVPELARLLDALADEPLTLLCTARPATLAARAAMQPYLIEELELRGLDERAIDELWGMLLASPPAPSVTRAIVEITAGNPLAVRSALRCAVRELRSSPTMPDRELVTLLERDADLMHEGLVAHLSTELREAAGRIAHLGEVVARRSAELLVDEPERTIERLTFAGILVPAASAATQPIAGAADREPPLAFTHSLVHRHLADSTEVDLEGLARLLAGDAPLFTLLPFELVAPRACELAGSFELLAQLHTRMHLAMRALDHRGQWPTVSRLLELAATLVESAGPRLDDERRRELEDIVVPHRLSLLRRESGSDRYRALLARALELSADPATVEQARARLFTLHYAQLAAVRQDEAPSASSWSDEIDDVLAHFPELIGSDEHVMTLGGRGQVAIAIDDARMLESVEREFHTLLDAPSITPALRLQLLQRVAPPLLLRFETPEQLEDRRALLTRIREAGGARTPFVETVIAEFLVLSGDFRHAVMQSRRAHRLCTDSGLTMNMINTRMSGMVAELALATPQPAECDARIDAVLELLAQVPARLRAAYAGLICSRMGEAGWVRIDDEWMRRLAHRLHDEEPSARVGAADAILLGCEPTGVAGCESADEWFSEPERRLAVLRTRLREGHAGPEEVAAAEELLATTPASTQDMVRRRALLELLGRRLDGFAAEDASRLRAAMADGLEHALGWLVSRDLHAAIPAWMTHYEGLLWGARASAWMQIASASSDESSRAATGRDDRLAISMLGEIRYGVNGGERVRLRGVRNRTLLGLMVAIEATGRPLTHAEFCGVATGIDNDAERARKMTNVAVHRLRELLGRETIDTAGETPRLALDAVSVDLLDATAQLAECERALREGIPARAVFAARRALSTLDGEVAWPTLYGAYFEAARDDLEIRLRRSLVRLGESLLREGDIAGAEELLRAAVESLPGDDELMELLEEARR